MTNDSPLVTMDAGREDTEVELLLKEDSATAYVAISCCEQTAFRFLFAGSYTTAGMGQLERDPAG